MDGALFTEDFKTQPYWLEHQDVANYDNALPNEIDVLVVGSGYSGLNAALQTTKAGLGTLVLDAKDIGYGCSSRNGGQVSPLLKDSYSDLVRRYGEQTAVALMKDGIDSVSYLNELVKNESLNCDWQQCGHFHGAHNPAAFNSAVKGLESRPAEVAVDWYAVNPAEQRSEIGTDEYHGGIVYPNRFSLQPASYHRALLSKVEAAGAMIKEHCAVRSIERTRTGFIVHTEVGPVKAKQVAIATNGFTGSATPDLRRRVIPIGSYIIATETLDPELSDEISPHNRTITDSRKVVFYYRLSPDRKHMVFGGRVSGGTSDLRLSALKLHKNMSRLFPKLENIKISHSWFGFVGYTFDNLPHIGQDNGLHYAMGYCGSGIALASYCGSIMGERLAGKTERQTAIEGLKFPARPYYFGQPWFVEPAVKFYRIKDALNL